MNNEKEQPKESRWPFLDKQYEKCVEMAECDKFNIFIVTDMLKLHELKLYFISSVHMICANLNFYIK